MYFHDRVHVLAAEYHRLLQQAGFFFSSHTWSTVKAAWIGETLLLVHLKFVLVAGLLLQPVLLLLIELHLVVQSKLESFGFLVDLVLNIKVVLLPDLFVEQLLEVVSRRALDRIVADSSVETMLRLVYCFFSYLSF